MTASTQSIIEIEDVQRKAFELLGLDPDLHARMIEETKYTKLGQIYEQLFDQRKEFERLRNLPKENDPVMISQIDSLYANYRTTAYQNPIIVSRFINIVSDFMKILSNDSSHDDSISQKEPLVATIPLGVLNGWVFETSEKHPVIVLQEGMRFTPLVFSVFIFDSIVEESPSEMRVHLTTDILKNRMSRIKKSALPLNTFLYQNTINDSMVGPAPEVIDRVSKSSDEILPLMLIQDGFESFVIAHELAHINMDHFSLDDGSDITHKFWQRHEDEIQEVVNKGKEKYPDLPAIDENDIFQYSVLQMAEHQADVMAMRYLAQKGAMLDMPPSHAMLFMIGAMSFFWYTELSERMIRLTEFRKDLSNEALYCLDQDVQNLYLRQGHPAPLSRLKFIQDFYSENDGFGFLSDVIDSLQIVFEVAWHVDNENLLNLVRTNINSVSKKWTWEHSEFDTPFRVFGL